MVNLSKLLNKQNEIYLSLRNHENEVFFVIIYFCGKIYIMEIASRNTYSITGKKRRL